MNKVIIILWTSLIMSQDENIENTIKTKISTGSVGTVTLNEDVYNHFSLYPEISIWKVNIGLDLYLYFNNDGIYTKNWDFSDANSSYKSIQHRYSIFFDI